MKRGRLARKLAVGLFATSVSVLNIGCVDTVGQNILVGLGFQLGSIPGDLIANYITGTFFGIGDTTTTQ